MRQHLRGRRARRFAGRLTTSFALAAPCASASSAALTAPTASTSAALDPSLTAAADANPAQSLLVIVQGSSAETAAAVVTAIGGSVRRTLPIVDGVAATIPAAALQTLAAGTGVRAVSLDGRVAGNQFTTDGPNLWQASAGVDTLSASDAQTPAIAVIDSGVDATRAADFGTRVALQVNLS